MRSRLRLQRRLPPPLPWSRPRHELALLVLVAIAALTPVYVNGAQDTSRICLTRALVHFRLSADSCLAPSFAVDKSTFAGHLYSDKAPGMSLIELPAVLATGDAAVEPRPVESLRVWFARVCSSGLAFLLCAFLVGRLAEGLAPGFGGVSLVAFALGTLIAPLAAANFEHGTAGALGLTAFLLAWRRRSGPAGLAAGAAVVVGYEAALIAVILAGYVALQGGRALAGYLLGVLPGAALLGLYDALAFGAPWHFSYRYIVGANAANQSSGFFGIHLPYLHAVREVFAGSGGLLVTSPIVLAAAAGLVLLGRRFGPEAIVCAAIVLAYLLLDCGYFLPYGGISPGPRFVIPCLPFLALGLGPAFAFRFRTTALLAAISIVATTALTLTWVSLSPDPGTIWSQLVHLPVDPSQIVDKLSSNVVVRLGVGRTVGAVLVGLGAAAAMVVALVAAARRVGDRASVA